MFGARSLMFLFFFLPSLFMALQLPFFMKLLKNHKTEMRNKKKKKKKLDRTELPASLHYISFAQYFLTFCFVLFFFGQFKRFTILLIFNILLFSCLNLLTHVTEHLLSVCVCFCFFVKWRVGGFYVERMR